MAEKTIPPVENETAVVTREITRNPENYITPLVDIYETPEGFTFVADLPGVEREGLEVKVDEGVLTLEGKTKYQPRGNVIAREFEPLNFFRQFELPEMVDREKISAELRQGVLTLGLPKLEKAKPKRINVHIG